MSVFGCDIDPSHEAQTATSVTSSSSLRDTLCSLSVPVGNRLQIAQDRFVLVAFGLPRGKVFIGYWELKAIWIIEDRRKHKQRLSNTVGRIYAPEGCTW